MARWFRQGISICLLGLLSACSLTNRTTVSTTLNSRYNDEQPSLSGNGRWLALVSNRRGNTQVLLYDLQGKRFENLSGFYSGQAIADSPSLSLTGRYLAYLVTIEGRPEIALYDRATKRSELLTQGYRSWIRNPHISADGRYIVFESARRGEWNIEVLDRGPTIELDVADGIPVVNP